MPLSVLQEAIEKGAEFEQRYLHQQEKNIALLTAIYVNSHMDLKKSEPVQPEQYFLHKPQSKFYIEHSVANTIFQLIKERALPEWLIYCLPRDEIRPFLRGKRVTSPRLWRSAENDDVMLFSPSLPDENGEVIVGIGIILNGFYGTCALKDVDTDQIHLVDIPQQEEPDTCTYQLKVSMA